MLLIGMVVSVVMVRRAMGRARVEPLVVYQDEVVAWDDNLENAKNAEDVSEDDFTDEADPF